MGQRACRDGTKRTGHLTGMASADSTALTRAPRRPVKPTAAGQRTAPPPAHRCTTSRSNPHRCDPTGSLREHTLPRLALEVKTHPRSLARKGRENFSERHRGTPWKTQAHPRFAFSLTLPLSRRHHPHHKARQRGRAPTQGGRQPWERASTRGRTRQSTRT